MLAPALTIAVLAVIFIQDVRGRAVYWFLFPVRAAALMSIHFDQDSALINMGFILVQLLILTIYFSLKAGRFVNITIQLLGWGDILFLVCVALYFPVTGFLLFYTGSLAGALLLWLAWQWLSGIKDVNIPLAGLQALMLMLLLVTERWLPPFNLIAK
jgi:hypothetical protein